jgi:ribonuclease HI
MSSNKNFNNFLKEKKDNSVIQISASYILEFKKCFVKISKIDGTFNGLILSNTKDGYLEDFNNFIFDFIKKNKISSSFNLLIDTHLSKNTALKNKMNKYKIDFTNFRTKKDLKLFNEFANFFIQKERTALLNRLQNYENNIMLYTDGSQKGKKCGMACIIDESNSVKKTVLTKSMRCDNEYYTGFELDAIIMGLEYITDQKLNNNSKKKIILTIDSDISNDICLNIKSKPYLQKKYPQLYNLMNLANFNIEINLIKSHVKELNNKLNKDFYFNFKVDELARCAASSCNRKNITLSIDSL